MNEVKFCSYAVVQEMRRMWIFEDKEYTGTSVVHDPYIDMRRGDVPQRTQAALLPACEANTQPVLHSCSGASCSGA